MSGWDAGELERIDAAEELDITTMRGDGGERKALPIWMVRVGDDLVIRSVNGTDASWYRAATGRGVGRISGGGVTRDVEFAPADPDQDDAVDAAYEAKYGRRYPSIVPRIVRPEAREAGLKVAPRG